MPVPTSGLYRVDHFQTYKEQQVLNTYWYREQGGSNDVAADLGLAFEANLANEIAAVQHVDVAYTLIKVTPVFGTGVEFNLTPQVTAGTATGTPMPSFMAASIRLDRSTNEVRNGWKRYCGLAEENVGATSFSGAYNGVLNALGTKLELTLNASPFFFIPVIVRKPFSTKAQEAFYTITDVGNTTTLNRPTTQNTRKSF